MLGSEHRARHNAWDGLHHGFVDGLFALAVGGTEASVDAEISKLIEAVEGARGDCSSSVGILGEASRKRILLQVLRVLHRGRLLVVCGDPVEVRAEYPLEEVLLARRALPIKVLPAD